jgi:hypothetical protein
MKEKQIKDQGSSTWIATFHSHIMVWLTKLAAAAVIFQKKNSSKNNKAFSQLVPTINMIMVWLETYTTITKFHKSNSTGLQLVKHS